jgi:hypothetical protein
MSEKTIPIGNVKSISVIKCLTNKLVYEDAADFEQELGINNNKSKIFHRIISERVYRLGQQWFSLT